MNKKEQLKKYLLEKEEVLVEVVREVNAYSGSLEDIDFHFQDEYFYETYFPGETFKAIEAVLYGEVNLDHEYVMFDAYGHLVSYRDQEMIEELKKYIDVILEEVIRYKDKIDIFDNEIIELLEEMEEDEE